MTVKIGSLALPILPPLQKHVPVVMSVMFLELVPTVFTAVHWYSPPSVFFNPVKLKTEPLARMREEGTFVQVMMGNGRPVA